MSHAIEAAATALDAAQLVWGEATDPRYAAAASVRAYLDAFDKAVIRAALNDPGQFVGPRGQGMRLVEWQLRAIVAVLYPSATDRLEGGSDDR